MIGYLAIVSRPKETLGGAKDDMMNPFKTNSTKEYSKPTIIKICVVAEKNPAN